MKKRRYSGALFAACGGAMALTMAGCSSLGGSATEIGLAGVGGALGYEVSDHKVGGAAAGATLTHEHPTYQSQGSLGVLPDSEEPIAVAGGIGPAPSPTGIAECDAYRDSIYELAACDGLDDAARKAILQSYDQAETAFAQVPPESRAALADACNAATKAIRDSMQTVCHPAPHAQAEPEPPIPVER